MFIKHSETGAILTIATTDKSFSDKYAGFIWVDDASIWAVPIQAATHYVLNGKIVECPTQSTLLTGLLLTQLPIPSTLHIDGTAYPVTESTVELDFPLPGTYRLKVEAFPYLDWTAEVTV